MEHGRARQGRPQSSARRRDDELDGESEPPESETCDDEGGDERDKSASADDEMAFIDDAFFELPDVATEEEAEGRGGAESLGALGVQSLASHPGPGS